MYVSVFFVRKYITGYVDVLRALNFLYKVASHHMLRATEIFSILKNGKGKSYISNFYHSFSSEVQEPGYLDISR